MPHPGSFLRQLTVVLLGLLPLAALAHGMPTTPITTAPALGASAAFDTLGRLYVVDAANGHVRLRHSDDAGRTFSAPVRVSEDHWQIDGCPEDGPSLAVTTDNVVHIVWPTLVGDASKEKAVFYSASTDGGQTFAPRVRQQRRACTVAGAVGVLGQTLSDAVAATSSPANAVGCCE